MNTEHSDGYKELQHILRQVEAKLVSLGRQDLAGPVENAQHFIISPGSEYLGISRDALARVVSARVLDPQTQALATTTIQRIDSGFRSVGAIPKIPGIAGVWPTAKALAQEVFQIIKERRRR